MQVRKKKKIEFQYTKDKSVDDDSNDVVVNNKDESVSDIHHNEIVDGDSNSTLDDNRDSEYTRSSDKDESADGDKKEL